MSIWLKDVLDLNTFGVDKVYLNGLQSILQMDTKDKLGFYFTFLMGYAAERFYLIFQVQLFP